MSMLWLWMVNFLYGEGKVLMPSQGTEIAARVDSLYEFLLIASLVSCILLLGGMTYFVYRYKKRSDNDKTPYITHNNFLEFLWSFIPLVIFIFVFAWGWAIFHDMRSMPKDALEVHVQGQKWAWTFKYKSGVESSTLNVPVNKPVKLIMTSTDVIHSFFIPSFRIKQDVVPGMYTTLSFVANKLGNFHIFCTEYCGTDHSKMLSTLNVMEEPEYLAWLKEAVSVRDLPLAEYGKNLYKTKGCVACHSMDGSRMVGPTFKGIFGRDQKLADGSTTKSDENYLRESILYPKKKVVATFPATAMPTFQGQLNEKQILALIEFLKEAK